MNIRQYQAEVTLFSCDLDDLGWLAAKLGEDWPEYKRRFTARTLKVAYAIEHRRFVVDATVALQHEVIERARQALASEIAKGLEPRFTWWDEFDMEAGGGRTEPAPITKEAWE